MLVRTTRFEQDMPDSQRPGFDRNGEPFANVQVTPFVHANQVLQIAVF